MLPATKRGRSGLRRVKSSAARRASSAARLVDLEDVLLAARTRPATAALPLKVSGLDDVGAGLEVGAVDVLDQLRLGEDQDLGAVLERHGMAGKRVAAIVLLRRAAGE